jgi:hypothetical protein
MLNTQKFLKYGGIALLAAFVLGYVGLGPIPTASLLGTQLYFGVAENLMHLLVGVIFILGYRFLRQDRSLRILSGILGVLLLVVSVIGLLNMLAPTPNAGLINLEPADAILHLVLALWGFWVAFMPEGPMFVRDEKTQASAT